MKAYGFFEGVGSVSYDRKRCDRGHPKNPGVGVNNALRIYKKIARRCAKKEIKVQLVELVD
jgi:hypothetical protein